MDQIAVDILTSGTPGEDIIIGPDKAVYDQDYDITDFSGRNLITKDAALQAFNFATIISIPSGSDYPLAVDMTSPTYVNVLAAFIAQFEVLNDVFAAATQSVPVWDCRLEKIYTDDTRSVLSSLNIYGHEDPGTPGQTIDELILIMR